MADADGPVVAPRGTSAARASQPDAPLDERWHIYDANPVPWWMAALWLGFFVFAVVYLIRNLLE